MMKYIAQLDRNAARRAEERGQVFFTSVTDGCEKARTAILSGPFYTYAAADEDLPRVKGLAEDRDYRAAFYAYGVCSTDTTTANKIKVLFPDSQMSSKG